MKLECTQHSTCKRTSKNNHQPQSQPEEAYFQASVTDTTEFRVTLKICLKTQTRVSRIVPAVSCHTLWFCPWTTRRPPRWAWEDRVQNNLVKKPRGWTEKLSRTPETEPELIDSHSLRGKASSYVDGRGLNGKKGSNFSRGLCGCQKIGFDWQLSGARLLQLLKRQPEK